MPASDASEIAVQVHVVGVSDDVVGDLKEVGNESLLAEDLLGNALECAVESLPAQVVD